MGNLYVVGTPIGNLNDITKRQLDTLKEVDLILCEDTRHSLKLLNYFDIKKKLISYHKFNEKEKVYSIIKDLKEDKNIALITDAGMPCISDPGYILVKECVKEHINVIPIGGISAVTTALSISGFDIKNFTFLSFFPRESKDKKELIKQINNSDVKVFVFYESPKRIVKTIEYLKEQLGNISIVVCSDLTKLHEKKYYGNIDKVLEDMKFFENVELGEYTVVIEKNNKIEEVSSISIEASLIELMIKNDITVKDAIDLLNKNNSNLSKKDIYNASLNLKNILKK